VNYFDTAVQYGNGESEKNLGRILQKLKPPDVAVGTKVRIPSGDFHRISDAVVRWNITRCLARDRCRRDTAGDDCTDDSIESRRHFLV
jgi:aryl-alcohol dehydrogenase-like predicted oxidoreductase